MNEKGFTLTELLIGIVWLGIIVLLLVAVPLWTERNLNFWLGYLKGHVVHVPFWISFVTSVILNGVIILLNILAEIGKFLI